MIPVTVLKVVLSVGGSIERKGHLWDWGKKVYLGQEKRVSVVLGERDTCGTGRKGYL